MDSTHEANPKHDFEQAMAHFGATAGDGIEWQLKLFSGDASRVLHEIRDLCRNFDLDEAYARGIARQALKLDALPDIGTLNAKSLVIVLRALKIHTNRGRAMECGSIEERPSQGAFLRSSVSK